MSAPTLSPDALAAFRRRVDNQDELTPCECAVLLADRDRLAAEVESLRKHVNATTAVSLTAMLESFESARAYSEQRAITDDDPGPALGSESSWRQASEAVAKLMRGAGGS